MVHQEVEVKLSQLKPGERAELVGYEDANGTYRRKLLSMGLTKGVELTLIKVAPLGDPVEVKVRGFSLSLRKKRLMPSACG